LFIEIVDVRSASLQYYLTLQEAIIAWLPITMQFIVRKYY